MKKLLYGLCLIIPGFTFAQSDSSGTIPVIDAKKRADLLEEKPAYSQSAEGIKLTFPEGIDNSNSVVSFVLNRSDDQNLDVKKTVKLDANRAFVIPASVLKNGNYTLRLHWIKDKIDYRLDYDVIWK